MCGYFPNPESDNSSMHVLHPCLTLTNQQKKVLQIIFGWDWRLVMAIRFSVGAASDYKGLSHNITSSFVRGEKYLIAKSKNVKIVQLNLTMVLVLSNTLSLIFTLPTRDWFYLLTCSSRRKLASWSLRSQLNRAVVSWSCLRPSQTGTRTCPSPTVLFPGFCVSCWAFSR